MAFPLEMKLPTEEELTVPEINLSMGALYAAANHLGKVCEAQNNEFMLCRTELDDPRKCLQEGKEVTKCALDLFHKIKKECHQEFEDFATCMHKNSHNWRYASCRNTQTVFDKCMLDKLGVERPPWGWNSEIHIHRTNREKPKEEPLYFPDTPEKYEPTEKARPAKFTDRFLY